MTHIEQHVLAVADRIGRRTDFDTLTNGEREACSIVEDAAISIHLRQPLSLELVEQALQLLAQGGV